MTLASVRAHKDDAPGVRRWAAAGQRHGTGQAGTYNVAGEGVLLLSQAAQRLRRVVPRWSPGPSATR